MAVVLGVGLPPFVKPSSERDYTELPLQAIEIALKDAGIEVQTFP